MFRLVGRSIPDELPRSVALEYLFARRRTNGGYQNVCHIWELAGGTLYTNLIDFALNGDTIDTFSAVLVADLSRPTELMDTLETLIDFVSSKIKDIVAKDAQLKDRLKNAASERMGETHEDLGVMTPLLVPLVIVGSKYDIFSSKFTLAQKKVINGYMRLIAHTSGAALVYISHTSESTMNRLTKILEDLAFSPQPSNLSMSAVIDVSKPLLIPFGCDSFQLIGSPVSLDDARRELDHMFPQEEGNFVIPDDPAKDPRYVERQIDLIYSVRKGQLEEYKSRLDLAKVNLSLE